jgi:hypothetical protein
MNLENVNIEEMYQRYKTVSDDEIRQHLQNIKVVRVSEDDKLIHAISPKALKEILSAPRKRSLTFDAYKISKKPIDGLRKLKDIYYVVKSSSRFFYKPDIGEIFDQIDKEDLPKIKAICFNSVDFVEIAGTSGEHFVARAILME